MQGVILWAKCFSLGKLYGATSKPWDQIKSIDLEVADRTENGCRVALNRLRTASFLSYSPTFRSNHPFYAAPSANG